MDVNTFWVRQLDRYYPLNWIDWTMRGCSQVMLQNNPLTGLIFFIGIFVSSWQAGMPQIAWGCLLATAVATVSANLLFQDNEALVNGLQGYNACLVGIALPVFLSPNIWLWICIVFSALVSVIITAGISRLLKTWHITALTAPFVFTTWAVLLASYTFLRFSPLHLPLPLLATIPSNSAALPASAILPATLDGVSQVFLCNSPVAGLIFLVGLAISSRRAVGMAICGSLIAILIAMAMGANNVLIASGMFAYSPVLTAITLGAVFNKPGLKTLWFTLIGIMFTVLAQGAFDTLLKPLGIPALTMPFVVVSWFFLLANQQCYTKPAPSSPKEVSAMIGKIL